jgi:hypothetical protein
MGESTMYSSPSVPPVAMPLKDIAAGGSVLSGGSDTACAPSRSTSGAEKCCCSSE